ncbi:MAG: SDR family NAD(P)-dependent oxidoreductase, partial [Acidimicrobiales bacterium]
MKDLAGRVAVVTGGAGGVGRALGERFGTEGMKVVLADVFADLLDEAVDSLRSQGHDVTG